MTSFVVTTPSHELLVDAADLGHTVAGFAERGLEVTVRLASEDDLESAFG